jgi:hypothetical protein
MPPKKIEFQWIKNADRQTPLSSTTERNYKSSLNRIASVLFSADGEDFHMDTVEKLLDYPEEIIAEVESLTHSQKVQTYAAIMYELGIGKKKDGTFSKLTPNGLKYYNAYQKTKLDSSGKPHSSQKIFETYEEYLDSFKMYEDSN